MNYKQIVPKFDATNFELSPLIAHALLEIEEYRNHKSESGEGAVEHLAYLLNEITQTEKFETIYSKYAGAASVLFEAIPPEGMKPTEFWQKYKESRGLPIDDQYPRLHISEVILQTNLVAKELRDFKSLPDERLKVLKEFCARLYRASSNYYWMWREELKR